MVSRDVLVALMTGTIVGFSLAAAYFISSPEKLLKFNRSTQSSPVLSSVEAVTVEEKDVGGNKVLKDDRKDKDDDDDNEAEEDDDEDEDYDEDPGAEPHKMVIVVNDSLKMGKGKIAAQCCHACLGAYKKASEKSILVWKLQGQPKIALKGYDVSDLEKVAQVARAKGLPHYLVADAGRTQIAAGSITACAIGPAPAAVIDKITGQFKLL